MHGRAYIIIIATVALLCLYSAVCLYALPFADDFCFGWTASQPIPFLTKVMDQYRYWNGRYSSNVLVNLHPLVTGKWWLYRAWLLAGIWLTPVLWYALLVQVVNGRLRALVTSLLITAFYLSNQPDVTNGVYWVIGVANYHTGNLAMLLQVALLVFALGRQGWVKWWWVGVSALLLAIAVGFNEVGAVAIPFFYLLATLAAVTQKHRHAPVLAGMLAVAVVAALFVVFSPGNAVRSVHFAERGQLFFSAGMAGLQTLRFAMVWWLSVPGLLLSGALVLMAQANRPWLKLNVPWYIPATASVAVLFASAFVPYYGTGMLGQHRTVNYAFFFAAPLWGVGVILFAQQHFNSIRLYRYRNMAFTCVMCAVAGMALLGNSRLIILDFYGNKFSAYHQAFMQRQQSAGHCAGGIPPLPHTPATFTITDARADSTFWVDKCMCNYYRHTGLRVQ